MTTPSGRDRAKSSSRVVYNGTPALRAMSAAPGAGSTIAAGAHDGLAVMSSMCRRPINPAPATATVSLRGGFGGMTAQEQPVQIRIVQQFGCGPGKRQAAHL